MRAALLAVLRFYQRAISPALPPRCRFYPSCSAYAVEAIERHGAARGTWLAVRRLVKCAPWHPGGLDPVPDRPFGRSPVTAPGTGDTARSSTRGATAPTRATPPAPSRTPQQEAGVA